MKDYFGFGSMRLVDWAFPVCAGLVYLAVRELNKWMHRRRISKMGELSELSELWDSNSKF